MEEYRLTPESQDLIKDYNKKPYVTYQFDDENAKVTLNAYSKNDVVEYFEVIEGFVKEDEESETMVFISLSTTINSSGIINPWDLDSYINLNVYL